MTIKLIRPNFTVTPHSSDFPDSAYALWQSGQQYDDGEIVRYEDYSGAYGALATVSLYKSTVANNATEPSSDNVSWVFYGTDNKWAMFDNLLNTTSVINTGTNSVGSVIFRIDEASTLQLLNLHCDYIVTRYYNSTNGNLHVVQGSEETHIINSSGLSSDDFAFKTQFQLDIPPPPNTNTRYIELEFHRSNGFDIEVGMVLFGEEYTINADVTYGLEAELTNYSSVKEDDFGNLELRKRAEADRLNCTVIYAKSEFQTIRRIFKRVQGEYVLLIPLEDEAYSSLTLFGVVQSFKQIIQYSTQSAANLRFLSVI